MTTHTRIDAKRAKIGHRIGVARRAKRLSIEDLARIVGVTYNAITQWETGRTAPSRANFHKVAKALQVEIEWLLTGGEPAEMTKAQTLVEADMLRVMRKLTPEQQENVVKLIAGFAGAKADGVMRDTAPIAR